MSGLPQTIVLRVVAYSDGSSPKSLAVHLRSCRVVYDLWEELFRVELLSDTGNATFRVRTVEDVLERCVVLRGTTIGVADDYRGRRGRTIHFGAIADLNPLSADTVQRIRRWIARPATDKVDGDAFFGSFVSLFVNQRIGQAERTVRFRTPKSTVP